jgi:tetratricopeptide (TPR) repeat protein
LGLYYQSRDPEKALEYYKKALELDPNYSSAHNQIGYLYLNLGNNEKAVEHINKYVFLNPGDANPIDSMAEAYFRIGRLDESIAKYKEALNIKPDFLMSLCSLPYVLALKEEYSEAIKTINRFINFAASPGNKSRGLLLRAFYYSWIGQIEKSLLDLQKAEELAMEVGNNSRVAAVKWMRWRIYLEKGDLERSRKYSQDWLNFCRMSFPDSVKIYECFYNFDSAFINLKEGKLKAAKSRLIEIENALSDLTTSQKENITLYIPLLEAEIRLAEGLIQESIDTIENMELDIFPSLNASHTLIYYNARPDRDIISRAYIKSGNLDKAIDIHERLVTFDPDDKDRRLIHPRYHYRLAVLYEQKGWIGKAIEHYEKFLELWKDADPGISEVDDARERLARLKGENPFPK